MKTFKSISYLTFIFLACSCSQVFYADFEKEAAVSSYASSGASLDSRQWTHIPHPADGFNIVTKATFIAQKLEQHELYAVNTSILALE